MPRSTLLSSVLALAIVWQCAVARVEERQTTSNQMQTTNSMPTTNAPKMDQAAPAMMMLTPVPLDMVEKGHTNEPKLRTWESFFWGTDPKSSVANLTVYMSNKNQMVISDDRISSLVSSVQCPKSLDQVTYTLKDDASYKQLKENWSWVNGEVFRSFVLTVADKGCQATPDGNGRQAYQVNGITFDDGKKQAVLKVQAKMFKDASGASNPNSGNSWEMLIDSAGLTAAQQKRRKRLDEQFSINLGRDFSRNLAKVGPVSLDCSPCFTAGSLSFRLQYSQGVTSKSTGSAEVRTSGVQAVAQIMISAQGAADPIIKNFQLGQVTIGGFTVGGVVTVGPVLSVGVNAQLNTLNVSGLATFGVQVTVPDSRARVDLFGGGVTVDGGRFSPNFKAIPPQAKAQSTIQGLIGPQIAIGVEASFFTVGASAGLVLLAPALAPTLQTSINTQGGVCNNPNIKAGINFSLDVAATFDAFAGLKPLKEFPNRKNIFATQGNVYTTCVGLAKRSEATPTPIAAPARVR